MCFVVDVFSVCLGVSCQLISDSIADQVMMSN